MTYDPIVIIEKADGSAELVGAWPLHTVIENGLLAHQRPGVSILTDPENTEHVLIQIGDQRAVYEKVGVSLGGGLVLDWVPRGAD